VVLGAALLPATIAALLRPAAWRGSGALAGTCSLITGLLVIAVVAADRTGAMVVAIVAACVCAALAVLASRLALGPHRERAVTSERAPLAQ